MYRFFVVYFFVASSIQALDQLPQDVFNVFMQQAVFLSDTQGLFSVVTANKKIVHQSKDWCKHERDPHVIEQLLHKACNNEPWTVCFALCNPHITSAMVGNALNDTTSNTSQKLLSARFPFALQDGPQEKLQIKHREGITRYIRNRFIIKKVYDEYNRSMPPLIYFSNCTHSLEENSFYPVDIYDVKFQSKKTFALDLNIIEILLDQQKANPSYGINLPLKESHNSVYFTPYSSVSHSSYKRIFSEENYTSLKQLLDKYKRVPEDNQSPYFE